MREPLSPGSPGVLGCLCRIRRDTDSGWSGKDRRYNFKDVDYCNTGWVWSDSLEMWIIVILVRFGLIP